MPRNRVGIAAVMAASPRRLRGAAMRVAASLRRDGDTLPHSGGHPRERGRSMTPILRRAPGEHPGLMTDMYHPDSAYVSWVSGRNGMTTFDLYTRSAPFGGAYLLVAGL